ncbi:hypothetical protein J6590_069958 [Homalodisca vitripennis]|nr:hypothetical protein J6590_069958 [Homalodisca vitripennis]
MARHGPHGALSSKRSRHSGNVTRPALQTSVLGDLSGCSLTPSNNRMGETFI